MMNYKNGLIWLGKGLIIVCVGDMVKYAVPHHPKWGYIVGLVLGSVIQLLLIPPRNTWKVQLLYLIPTVVILATTMFLLGF